MSKVFFDIETDGLLESVSKLHCLEMCYENGNFNPNSLDMKVQQLKDHANEIIGHNIICYDIPALKVIFGSFKPSSSRIVDTLLLSRMLYPEVEQLDMTMAYTKKSTFALMKEKKLIGKHSLEAWGYRLGIYKGDFGKTTDWKVCTPEMVEYCKQDVLVTKALYEYFIKNNKISWNAYDLEYEFQVYIFEQTNHGCYFDVGKAIKLKQKLITELDSVKAEIKKTVPDWVEETVMTPKVNNATRGYVKGVPFTKRKTVPFNPNSRPQIEKFLKQKYNWQPSELTETGRAKISETILDELEDLDWHEAQLFSRYLTITKLIGYIADGDNAWLKLVKNGKIHGQMVTNGAITRRTTHFKPNISQIPSPRKYMGKECREIWYAPKGFKFVGGDAQAIELRMFAHYLAAYDGGEYASVICNGDIHVHNQKLFAVDSRDLSKKCIYTTLYGCGAEKLGATLIPKATTEAKKTLGARVLQSFKTNNPHYTRLLEDVKRAYNTRGYIVALDGHRLKPRAAHSALNTLLQCAATIVMKRATVIFKKKLEEKEWWLTKFFPTFFIHDDIEGICLDEVAEEVSKMIPQSIKEAGEYYKLKIPLDGSHKVGVNFYETH